MTAQHPDDTATNAGGDPNIEQIQADIEHTREELGATVDALTAKLDVKTRTKAKLADTKDQAATTLHQAQEKATHLGRSAQDAATDDQGKPKPAVVAAATAVLVILGALVAWTTRRRSTPRVAQIRD